jgi:hypothetical protein
VLALLRQASLRFGELGSVGPDIIRGLAAELHDLPRSEVFLIFPEAMMTVLRRAGA